MLVSSLYCRLDKLNSLESNAWKKGARQTGKDFGRAL